MKTKKLKRIIDDTIFEAEDGTLFISEKKCQEYEKKITT